MDRSFTAQHGRAPVRLAAVGGSPISVVPKGPPVPEETAAEAAWAAGCEVETVQAQPRRIGWARLLKRILDIDMQHGPNCSGGEVV